MTDVSVLEVLLHGHEIIALFHQHWEAEKHHLPMSSEVREAIENHKKTLSFAQ